MSAASDVTALRQILARYSVDSQSQNTWTTSQPISTSSSLSGASLALSSQSIGTVTLSGTASTTVTTAACKPTSYVFLTNKTFSNQGYLRVTANTGSFIITSTSNNDSSIIQWMIVNPA